MREMYFRQLDSDRRTRDATVPLRARAMEDADHDFDNALGAVLTFEPGLDCMTDEYQNWLKVLWLHKNEKEEGVRMTMEEMVEECERLAEREKAKAKKVEKRRVCYVELPRRRTAGSKS